MLRRAPLRVPGVVGRSLVQFRGLAGIPYSELSVGVPKETAERERRVSQTPETVTKLVKEGFTVLVERGAGVQADFSDSAYAAAGAKLVSRDEAFKASLVTKAHLK